MSIKRHVKHVLALRKGTVVAVSRGQVVVDVGGTRVNANMLTGVSPNIGDSVLIGNFGNEPVVLAYEPTSDGQEAIRQKAVSSGMLENQTVPAFFGRIQVAAGSTYTVAHGLGRPPRVVFLWHESASASGLALVTTEAAVQVDDTNIIITTGAYTINNAARQETGGYYNIYAE